MPFAPMLATSGGKLRGDGWAVEPKLDGWRAIVEVDDLLRVRTRNGHDITARVPELGGIVSALGGHSAVLDGELVAGGGLPEDFYRLLPRLSTSRPMGSLTFVAFDLLELDHAAMIALPYTERRARLESVLSVGPAWMGMPSFTDDPLDVFRACVEMGLEGIVAKRCRSHYQPGKRSADWVKAKAPAWREHHAPRRHEHG